VWAVVVAAFEIPKMFCSKKQTNKPAQ